MKDIYAILDIGSSTIKLLVGEAVSANINVLFSKKIPSHGVRKGIIVDEALLINDIQKLIKEANEFLDAEITSVGLNIPPIKVKLYQSDSSISIKGTDNVISEDDVVRALRLSSKFKRSEDEEIVSVIPVKYHSDIGATREAPIGKVSRNLIVDTLVITVHKRILYQYIMAVERSGLQVLEISINAYSCANEAFDAVYLQEGAILIDIGYKTSTISFYKDGYLHYLTTVEAGGYDFTRGIAMAMQIPMARAETYKIKYGSLDIHEEHEDIIHTTYFEETKRDYTQHDLAKILNETVHEVMEKIKDKLSVIDEYSKYEILLVGGGSELESLDRVASEVLESPVRMYRPNTIGVRDMAFVSCAGMIYYLMGRSKILGKYEPSVELPDISHTMSIRLGVNGKLTKEGKTSKWNRLLDTFLGED